MTCKNICVCLDPFLGSVETGVARRMAKNIKPANKMWSHTHDDNF